MTAFSLWERGDREAVGEGSVAVFVKTQYLAPAEGFGYARSHSYLNVAPTRNER